MREYINWIIDVSKTNYANSRFKDLNTNTAWNELPILVKLFFLDENLNNYPIDEQGDIEKFIRESQSDVDFNEPSKVVARVIQIIDYVIEKFPYHELEERSMLLLKFKEIVLRDSFIGKNTTVTKSIDDYLTKKLEIIKNQREYSVFDEQKEEMDSIETYEYLKNAYESKKSKLAELIESKDIKFGEDIARLFIDIYLEIPNFTVSNSEKFIPYTFSFIKKRFNDITIKKIISTKSAEDFKQLLKVKEKDLKESLDQILKVKSTMNPHRYYMINRLHMRLHYFEKCLLNTKSLINYINNQHSKNGIKKTLPENFEETILDKRKLKEIIIELKYRGFLNELDNKYYWKLRSPELVSLLEKLHTIKLLNYSLERNYCFYGKLICSYFNFKFTESSWRPSKISTKNNLFQFIKN